MMYFKRLEDLRQDRDLTQQDIADLLNCKCEVYRRYEKGERELPTAYAVALAKHYGVTLDYLLDVENIEETE